MMNERIKELAELAELNTTLLFNKDKLEKFAELIVLECAGIYEAIDNGNRVEGTDNYLEALQKRFGVER